MIAINIAAFVLIIGYSIYSRREPGVSIWDIPTENVLLQWGAVYRPLIAMGETWRLFTAMFLHVGEPHLFFNMCALLGVGMVAEGALGPSLFAFSYLVTGLCASVAGELYYPTSVSVGASGAIFGITGLLVALMVLGKVSLRIHRGTYAVGGLLAFAGLNFFFGAIAPNINNAAHVGGFAAGLAVGTVFALFLPARMVQLLPDGVVISYGRDGLAKKVLSRAE
ncbi:MAG: rhomboid family intramembrane serine protease [Terriglobales bacterium]